MNYLTVNNTSSVDSNLLNTDKHNEQIYELSNTFKYKNEQQEKEVKEVLLNNLKALKKNLEDLDDQELIKLLKSISNHLLLHKKIKIDERLPLIQKIFDNLRGLGIIQNLLDDNTVTEIMINGPDKIFIEQNGLLKEVKQKFKNNQELNDFISKIFAKCNRRIDNLHPIADGVLQDGSRINAVLSPISSNGSSLTIRKFCGIKPKLSALISENTITEEASLFLKNCILNKDSIFICGGTGSGKTTLLNILSSFIPLNERIITIEDACELELQQLDNWVRLEARNSTIEQQGEISIATLIKAALRMRPDRLIVGEVRHFEAYDLIHAANTGHPGSLSTGHANSCYDMIRRLANLIMSSTRLPYEVILENIKGAFTYFIYLKKLDNGKRRVIEISKLNKVEGLNFELTPIYLYNPNKDCLEKKVC